MRPLLCGPSYWCSVRRDAGVVERARLESECVLNGAPRVRIPLSPPLE